MIDDLLAHWNDVLTVLAFAIAAISGYYQVQHYRAQNAEVNIVEVKEANYEVQTTGIFDPASGDLEDEDGEIMGTKYSITALVENDGREPATISHFSLHLSGIDEVVSLESERTKRNSEDSFVQLGANERAELHLSAKGDVLDEYEDVLKGLLQLDTTAGVVERRITLSRES